MNWENITLREFVDELLKYDNLMDMKLVSGAFHLVNLKGYDENGNRKEKEIYIRCYNQ